MPRSASSALCGSPHHAETVREWPWTPRFQHLLVDQSQAKVGEVRGEALGRVAQLALMAAARRRVSQGRAPLLMAAQYMGELARSGRIELFGAIVRYRTGGEDVRRGVAPGGASGGPPGRSAWHDRELLAGRNRVVGHQGGYRYRPGRPGTPPTARRVGSYARVTSCLSLAHGRAAASWHRNFAPFTDSIGVRRPGRRHGCIISVDTFAAGSHGRRAGSTAEMMMKQPWESTRPHSGASGSESTQRTAGQSPSSEAGAAASTAACAPLPH